jgi:hypothetical protein
MMAGPLDVNDVQPMLVALDAGSISVRQPVLDSLVEATLTPTAREAVGVKIGSLLETVDQADDAQYTRTVFVVAARLDVQDVSRRLSELAGGDDAEQRREAAYVLAETNHDEALDALVLELDLADAGLQREAAIRLPLLDVTREAGSLRSRLDAVDSVEARFWIALALVRSDEEKLGTLTAVLGDMEASGADAFQLVSEFEHRFRGDSEDDELRGIVAHALGDTGAYSIDDLTFGIPHEQEPAAEMAEEPEEYPSAAPAPPPAEMVEEPESPPAAAAPAPPAAAAPAPPAAAEEPAVEPPPAVDAGRHINAWLGDDSAEPPTSLKVGRAASLNFQVGEFRRGLTVRGDTRVPDADVPEDLNTEWVVTTRGVELTPVPGDESVTISQGEANTWIARFSLTIPTRGDSEVRSMMIAPRADADGGVPVTIFVGTDVYRTLEVTLPVHSAGDLDALSLVTGDVKYVEEAHLNLATTHEWTTPPGVLTLKVTGNGQAFALGDVPSQGDNIPVDQGFPWIGALTKVGGLIRNVRTSAERLRAEHEDYLNAIDAADLALRLGSFTPIYDWGNVAGQQDANHDAAWQTVHRSKELHDLAFDGARLLNAFFREGMPSRAWLESLQPGWRINISWIDDPDGVAQVPWGLMYLGEPPALNEVVDPMCFLGLRFRLAQTTHPVNAPSRALGALTDTHRATFLYWGEGDATATEAEWQAHEFGGWTNQVFVPAQSAADRKAAVVQALEEPEPEPVNVMYLFCQCSVGDGNEPRLRFGSSLNIADVLDRTELGAGRLRSSPLVFANACSTSGADPFVSNALEDAFFERGSRAFVGTETKVPIILASRFASIFFHFFYRIVDSKPMAAGEALAQSRLFLWSHYRNIGGLLYAYVNEYDLYAASSAEVAELRR